MAETLDVTTPSDLEIKMVRVFNAPATLLFDYHTKPEKVQKWLLGPPGWTMPVCEIDLKVGGRYRYAWRKIDKSVEFGSQGEYLEILAPERIVHTDRMDGADGEALCTLTLVEAAGRTTLTSTMKFASKAARDEALESGMTDGVSTSYDRLEEAASIAGI